MKTAQEWQDELCGETSVESIRAIQLDSLTWAAMLLTINADSRTRGFNAVHKLVVELQEDLEKRVG
jgi:hypothetical protein